MLKSTQMRDRLNVFFADQKEKLKAKLRQQSALHLIVDETTDSRSILNIVVRYYDPEKDELRHALLKSVDKQFERGPKIL